MASKVDIYEVFISSPSDVADERNAVVECLSALNRYRGKREGFRLEPLMWEHDTRPEMGGHPQGFINSQIGQTFEIFVGILCARFGTRTKDFESGTEEEFNLALERRQKSGKLPILMIYFKDARASSSKIDAGQLAKVYEFKERISKIGLFGEFSSYDDLKTKITAHLSQCIDVLKEEHYQSEVSQTNKPPIELVETAIQVSDLFPQEPSFDDAGIIELNETITRGFSSVTENLGTFLSAQNELTEVTQKCTVDIGELKRSNEGQKVSPKEAIAIFDRMASALDQFRLRVEFCVPQMDKDFALAADAMRRAVVISGEDSFDDYDSLLVLDETLRSLRSIIQDTDQKISDFSSAVGSIPRFTSRLNASKRSVVNSLRLFSEFSAAAISQIDVVLANLERALDRQNSDRA